MTFRAYVQSEAGKGEIAELSDDKLPTYSKDGDVTVRIDYSTLNYKDGMVLKGVGRLVRAFPHIPGIDFAGTVEQSGSPAYQPGDTVVLNGWRVGEAYWGGYAQRARVRADWLVPLPKVFSTRQAMAIGTAGYTAMLALLALEDHGLTPSNEGEVLVTGASGGVGSIATAILAKNGYKVAAATGRAEQGDYLKALGATTIVPRAELEAAPSGPLATERWAAAIDNVGGTILANLLTGLKRGAACAAVGLAASNELKTTVIPFLLRGVALLGIDSSATPFARRKQAWDRLARDLDPKLLESAVSEVALSDIAGYADKILKGQVRGRIVVDVNR